VIIREYTESDHDRIKELHQQSGFDYQLPALSGEEFFSRRVIEGDNAIGMAAFLRLTAEAYLVCDPSWRNPAWRVEALRQLSLQCNSDARDKGVIEVEAFLPPQVATKFGLRLKRMGWVRARDGWVSYSHKVE
jgi:hypothetical protein